MELADNDIIKQALDILEQRITKEKFDEDLKQYCCLQIGSFTVEAFAVVLLDVANNFLGFKVITTGTVKDVVVFPREIARIALSYNASRIIITHNHPTGEVWPSKNDLDLTTMLRDALQLVDVELVDHLIVGGSKVLSLKEEGLYAN